MICEKASEVLAYLQGEGGPEERETLRPHLERCPACGEELARMGGLLRSLRRVQGIEPSAGFRWRVREAFVRENPEFLESPKPESAAWSVSVTAHAILLAAIGILFFAPPVPHEPRPMAVELVTRPLIRSERDAIRAAQAWLESVRDTWGEHRDLALKALDVEASAAEVEAVLRGVERRTDELLASQAADGSWGGRVRDTALATLLLRFPR